MTLINRLINNFIKNNKEIYDDLEYIDNILIDNVKELNIVKKIYEFADINTEKIIEKYTSLYECVLYTNKHRCTKFTNQWNYILYYCKNCEKLYSRNYIESRIHNCKCDNTFDNPNPKKILKKIFCYIKKYNKKINVDGWIYSRNSAKRKIEIEKIFLGNRMTQKDLSKLKEYYYITNKINLQLLFEEKDKEKIEKIKK